jgi:hypothetical protein
LLICDEETKKLLSSQNLKMISSPVSACQTGEEISGLAAQGDFGWSLKKLKNVFTCGCFSTL